MGKNKFRRKYEGNFWPPAPKPQTPKTLDDLTKKYGQSQLIHYDVTPGGAVKARPMLKQRPMQPGTTFGKTITMEYDPIHGYVTPVWVVVHMPDKL
jgi:hypothetical protein